MKAVYEMPYVRIEEFTPNVTVATCVADEEYTFDCLRGPNADNASLISETMGIDCDNDCGFTSYNDIGSYEVFYEDHGQNHSGYNDTLTWEGQTKTGVDKNGNATFSGTWTGSVFADSSKNFLGWLYIGREVQEGNHGQQPTVKYDDVESWIENAVLHLKSTIQHVLLAPVYGASVSDFSNS